jgi:hypothetical protein
LEVRPAGLELDGEIVTSGHRQKTSGDGGM